MRFGRLGPSGRRRLWQARRRLRPEVLTLDPRQALLTFMVTCTGDAGSVSTLRWTVQHAEQAATLSQITRRSQSRRAASWIKRWRFATAGDRNFQRASGSRAV